MRKLGITVMLGMMLTGAWAQTEQDRNVGEFTGIKAGGVFTITVVPGSTSAVKVSAEESVINNIKTEVKDGMLTISTDGKVKTEKPMNIMVTVRELKKVDISGAAKLSGTTEMATDKMDISASGQVQLPVKVSELNIDASGAGKVTLSGTAGSVKAEMSGAADLKAYELEAGSATITASGASNARINVKESIIAESSGASSVTYKGSPTAKTINKSGSGSVRSADSGSEDASNSTGSNEGRKSGKGDTTKVNLGSSHVLIINDEVKDKHEGEHGDDKDKKDKKYDKDDFKHWSGIDLGVNGYLNAKNKLEMPSGYDFLELDYSRSINVSVNFLEKDIHIYKNYVRIVTGLGLEFSNYRFKNNITLNPDTSYITATTDSMIDYSKNKLKTTFINLPLLLEFHTHKNPKKAVHIAGGVILGYKLGSKTKQEFEIEDREYKLKIKDDYNLSPFRYSATVRAGYGNFTVFANYALAPLFEKNKGPKLYPFTAGVAMNLR
jgi:hypothetical protein